MLHQSLNNVWNLKTFDNELVKILRRRSRATRPHVVRAGTAATRRLACRTHQVSKLDGGQPSLDDGPQTPEEVGRQGEPAQQEKCKKEL